MDKTANSLISNWSRTLLLKAAYTPMKELDSLLSHPDFTFALGIALVPVSIAPN